MLKSGAVNGSGSDRKRRCTACKRLKPISEFYARYTKNGNIGMSKCKVCFLADQKFRGKRRTERRRAAFNAAAKQRAEASKLNTGVSDHNVKEKTDEVL